MEHSDAEVLLAALLKCDRGFLIAHPDDPLTHEEQVRWTEYVERRSAGEPISYIVGSREFYGRSFLVDRRVHIPRPSTENLVAMTLQFLDDPKEEVRTLETGIIGVSKILRDCSDLKTVVDVGTGSGCIAITLALERPDLRVMGIDIKNDALEVAKENAVRLGARVEFLQGELLSPVERLTEPFIVVSNPPYLSPEDISAHPELRDEPQIALLGGARRDTLIKRLEQEASAHQNCTGTIMERMP